MDSGLIYEDEPVSAAQKQNRLLFGSRDIDDPDDRFLKAPGGQGMSSRPVQRQAPLIEEEEKEPAQSMSKPGLTDSGKANLARYIYAHNQAIKPTPWKKGMPYSQSVLSMFDPDRQGVTNPRQAANAYANRPGGFQKLFGAKTTAEERKNRPPRKSWWGRVKSAYRSGSFGKSLMNVLFGARRKPAPPSLRSMGIRSTNAPNGQSSGWADQLVEAGKAGMLGEGAEGGGMSEQLLPAGGGQQAVHQSAEHIVEDEEKVGAPLLGGGPSAMNFGAAMEKQRRLNSIFAPAKDSPANNSVMMQQNEYGNPEGTEDDNSIDQDAQSQVEDDDEQQMKNHLNMQFYLDMFNKDDD